MEKISVEQYVESRKQELDLFLKHWRKGQAHKGNSVYPEAMPEGDWYDQEIAFNSVQLDRD